MSRIAYVNGSYLPQKQAGVHIEDRGYQFADGVYEVCELRNGNIVDEVLHLARLERSLNELQIAKPMSLDALKLVMRFLIQKNRVQNGLIYLQITRGVSPRDHAFPPPETKSSLVMTIKPISLAQEDAKAESGIAVRSVLDNRWGRVDIKSVSLLPNVLAKQYARENDAYEAWFIDDEGYVTEGSSTNAWIITMEGTLVTRPADHHILRGITRTTLLQVASELGIKTEERPFTLEEAKGAREAFITAATTIVIPVVQIDETVIGNGVPGSIASNLRANFHKYAKLTKF